MVLPSCLLKRLNRLRVAVKRVFALARVRALRCVFECVCVFAWYRHTLNLIWTIWGENEQPSMVMIRYGNVVWCPLLDAVGDHRRVARVAGLCTLGMCSA